MKKSIVLILIVLLGLSGCIGVWGDKTAVKPKYEKTATDYYEIARTNLADPYKVLTPDDVEKNVIENAKMAEGKSLLEKDTKTEIKSKLLRAMAQNYKGQLLTEEGANSSNTAISRSRVVPNNNSKAELEFAEANISLSALEYMSVAAKAMRVDVLSNWSQIDKTKLIDAVEASDDLAMVQDQIDSNSNLQSIKVAGQKIEAEDVLTKVADIYIKKGDTKKAMAALVKAQDITKGKNKTVKDSKVLKIKIKMADVLIDSGQPEVAAKVLKGVVDEAKDMTESTDIKDKAKAKLIAEGLQRVQAMAEAGVDLSNSGINTQALKDGLANVKTVGNAGTKNLISDIKLARIKDKVTQELNTASNNIVVGKDKEINNAYSQLLIGNITNAEKLFSTLIGDNEVLANTKYTRDVIFGLALVYIKEGQIENAIETYKRVPILIPDDSDSIKRAAIEISKLSEDSIEENATNKLVVIPPTLKKTSFLPGDTLNLEVEIMYSDMKNIDKNIEVKASIYNKQGEKAQTVIKTMILKYNEKNIFQGDALIGPKAISGQYKLVIAAKEKNGSLYSKFEMPIFIGRISDIKNNTKIDMIKLGKDKDIFKVELLNFKTNSGIKLKVNSTEAAISMAGEAIYSLASSEKTYGEHEMNVELYQNNKVIDTRIFKYKIGDLVVISDITKAAIEVKVKDIVSKFNGSKKNILSLVDDNSNLYNVLNDKLTTSSAIEITRETINKPIVDKYGNFAIVRTNEKITVDGNEIPYYQEYKLVRMVTKDTSGNDIETWKIRNIAFLDNLFINSQNMDTDNDGLTDKEEANLGTNPNNPDSDGDGYTDGEEVAKGSDPLDKDSIPVEEEKVSSSDTVAILNQILDILSNPEKTDTIEGFINGNSTESAINFINKYYTANSDETFKEDLKNKIENNLKLLRSKNVELEFIKPNVIESKLNEIPFDLRQKGDVYTLNLDITFDLKDDSGKPIFSDTMHLEFIGKSTDNTINTIDWKVRYMSKLENGFFVPEILKPADNIDNDGDGLIDEELPDGIDNDGDGLVDEDLRNPIGGDVNDKGKVKFILNDNNMKFVQIMAKYSVKSTNTSSGTVILKGIIRKFGRIQTKTTEDKLPLNTELKVKIDVEGVGKYESDWFKLTSDAMEKDLGDITSKLVKPIEITFPENGHEFDLSSINAGKDPVKVEFNKLDSKQIKTYAVIVATDIKDIEQENSDNYVAVKLIDASTTESAISWEYKESSMDDFNVNNGFAKKLLQNINYITVVAAFKEGIATLKKENGEPTPVVISKPVIFKVNGVEGLEELSGDIYNNKFIPFGVNIAVMKNMPTSAKDAKPDYLFRIDQSSTAGWDPVERAFKLPFEIYVPDGTYYIGAYLDINNNGRVDEGDLLTNLLGEKDNNNDGKPDGFVVDEKKIGLKLYLRENMGGDTIKGNIKNNSEKTGDLITTIFEYNKNSMEPHGNFVSDMITGSSAGNDNVDYKMNFKPYGDGNVAFGIETFIDVNQNRMLDPGEPKSAFTKFYDNGEYIIDKENIDSTIEKVVIPGDGIDNDKDGEVIGRVILEGGVGNLIDFRVLIHKKDGTDNFLFKGTTTNVYGEFDIGGLPVELSDGEKLMIEFNKDGYKKVRVDAGINKDMHTNTLELITLTKGSNTSSNEIIGKIEVKEPINQNIILGLFENDPKNMNEFRPKYRFEIDKSNYTTESYTEGNDTKTKYVYSYDFTIPEIGLYYIAAMVDNDANNMVNQNDFAGMLNDAVQIKAGDNQITEFGLEKIQEGNTLEVTITNSVTIQDVWNAGIFTTDGNGNRKYITDGEWNGSNKIYFRNVPLGSYVIEVNGKGFEAVEDYPVKVNEVTTQLALTLKTPIRVLSPMHSVTKDDTSGNYKVNFQWNDNTPEVNTYVIAVKQGDIVPDKINGPADFDTAIIMVDKATKEWTYIEKAKETGSVEFANALKPNFKYGYMILGFAETKTELEDKINNNENVEPIISSEPNNFLLVNDAIGKVQMEVINTNNVPIPSDGKILVAIFKDFMPMGENSSPTGDQLVGIKEGVAVSSSLLPGNTGDIPEQSITVPISSEISPAGAIKGYIAFVMITNGAGNEIEELFGADLVKFDSAGVIQPVKVNMIGGASDEVMGLFAKKVITLNLNLPTEMNIDYSENVRIEANIDSENIGTDIAYKNFRLNSANDIPKDIKLYIMQDYNSSDNYKINTRIYYDNGNGNKEEIAGSYDTSLGDGSNYSINLQLKN